MKEGEGKKLFSKSPDGTLSRRRFLQALPAVALGLAAIAFVGCEAGSKENTTSTPQDTSEATPTPAAAETPTPEIPTVISETPIPTATPEWFDGFPDSWSGPFGMYIAPGAEPAKADPTGNFIENELIFNPQDYLTKEEIAEFLAQRNLTVRWIKSKERLGSFGLAVNPDEQDAILTELNLGSNKSVVEYAEKNWLR